jgi:hypothetical protein
MCWLLLWGEMWGNRNRAVELFFGLVPLAIVMVLGAALNPGEKDEGPHFPHNAT